MMSAVGHQSYDGPVAQARFCPPAERYCLLRWYIICCALLGVVVSTCGGDAEALKPIDLTHAQYRVLRRVADVDKQVRLSSDLQADGDEI
jgi:hypothetical protein